MARPQLFILKLEVQHGSDRHEISMYSPTPPTVGELIDELEKKTRVPASDIQIIFKGQKLHFNRSAALQQFGIFSGSRMLMVGQKLNPTQDATFRRILGVSKDVGLIEKTLNDTEAELSFMQNGGIDRSMSKEYLPQLHQRTHSYKVDLEAFLRVINELAIDANELPDVKKKQDEVVASIKSDIRRCDSLINAIAKMMPKQQK